MHYEYFATQEQTFTRFTPTHMVRAALVRGLYPDNPKHEDYLKLVKQYLKPYGIDPGQKVIDSVYQWIQGKIPKEHFDKTTLEHTHMLYLYALTPRKEDHWKVLNYEHLKDEGVIKTVDGNLDDIVNHSFQGRPWEVVLLDNTIAESGIDYIKHIPLKNEVRLDSAQVIRAFAEKRHMKLPPEYYGERSASLLKQLRMYNYNLIEAITTALTQYQGSGNKHSVISFINYTTGDEVRIFPIDLVEMVEHFFYFRNFGSSTTEFELGDAAEKYAGSKTLIVPKRRPDERFRFNKATLEYLAEFYKAPYIDPVWWLNFRAECSCVYSKEKSLFKIERGEKKRIATIFDPHIGNGLLTILVDLKKDPRAHIPIPSKKTFTIADYARFNIAKRKEGSKELTYLTEDEINILLLHSWKAEPQRAFVRPRQESVSSYALQPLHP